MTAPWLIRMKQADPAKVLAAVTLDPLLGGCRLNDASRSPRLRINTIRKLRVAALVGLPAIAAVPSHATTACTIQQGPAKIAYQSEGSRCPRILTSLKPTFPWC
jgi:hypothetical protein